MVIQESLHHDFVANVEPFLMRKWLVSLIDKKDEEIQSLKDKILKYEQKNRAEDAFYQSLSPIRKLFTARAPSHHKAVEYMVNVKDRMKKIEILKLQVNELNRLLETLQDHEPESLIISHPILEDLRPLIMIGDSLS